MLSESHIYYIIHQLGNVCTWNELKLLIKSQVNRLSILKTPGVSLRLVFRDNYCLDNLKSNDNLFSIHMFDFLRRKSKYDCIVKQNLYLITSLYICNSRSVNLNISWNKLIPKTLLSQNYTITQGSVLFFFFLNSQFYLFLEIFLTAFIYFNLLLYSNSFQLLK